MIAVDWGTSSFRLWLMNAAGEVLDERRSDEGMAMASAACGFATFPLSDGRAIVLLPP